MMTWNFQKFNLYNAGYYEEYQIEVNFILATRQSKRFCPLIQSLIVLKIKGKRRSSFLSLLNEVWIKYDYSQPADEVDDKNRKFYNELVIFRIMNSTK